MKHDTSTPTAPETRQAQINALADHALELSEKTAAMNRRTTCVDVPSLVAHVFVSTFLAVDATATEILEGLREASRLRAEREAEVPEVLARIFPEVFRAH